VVTPALGPSAHVVTRTRTIKDFLMLNTVRVRGITRGVARLTVSGLPPNCSP
jgi:hypothetical protein